MQSSNNDDLIVQDNKIVSNNIKIIGLYDPQDHGLDINMWSNLMVIN